MQGAALEHHQFRHPFYDRARRLLASTSRSTRTVCASARYAWRTSVLPPLRQKDDEILTTVMGDGKYAPRCPLAAR